MNMPNDPIILFSFVNTKLRDFYPSLDAFCDDFQTDKQELISKLSVAGFEYNKDTNQFV